MENLKNQLEVLRQKFIERIETDEFTVIKINPSSTLGYIGEISIEIDGCIFYFSVYKEAKYAAQHRPEIDLSNHIGPEALKKLHDKIVDRKKELLKEKLKEVQEQLNELE